LPATAKLSLTQIENLDALSHSLVAVVEYLRKRSLQGKGELKEPLGCKPDPWTIARHTDYLFFNGTVGYASYHWEEPEVTVERQRGRANASYLAYTEVWNCGSKFPKARVALTHRLLGYNDPGLGHGSESAALYLLGTILHEQIHLYTLNYSCEGDSSGSYAQKQLCRFLHSKVVKGYNHVAYKGTQLHDGQMYEHGPVFSVIGREIADIVDAVSKFWTPSIKPMFTQRIRSLWAPKCECAGAPSCLLHCFPRHNELLNMAKQNLWKDLVKLGFDYHSFFAESRQESKPDKLVKWLILPEILPQFATWYAGNGLKYLGAPLPLQSSGSQGIIPFVTVEIPEKKLQLFSTWCEKEELPIWAAREEKLAQTFLIKVLIWFQ
jgi:hypothetical protein